MRYVVPLILLVLLSAIPAEAGDGDFLITDFDGKSAAGYAFFANNGDERNEFAPQLAATMMDGKAARVSWLSKWAGCEFVFDAIDGRPYTHLAFDIAVSAVLDKNIFCRLMTTDGESLYRTVHMRTSVTTAFESVTIRVPISDFTVEKGTKAAVLAALARVQVGMEFEEKSFETPVYFYIDNVRLER